MYNPDSNDSSSEFEDDLYTNAPNLETMNNLSDHIDYKLLTFMDSIDPDNNILSNTKNDCLYYTDSTYDKIFIQDKNISLIHFNSRSLQSNFEAIQDYLNQFKSQFNIIAISETWLNEEKNK